jgi:hypothetical protein
MTNPYRKKLEDEYEILEKKIYWQDLRSKIVSGVLILLIGISMLSGIEVFFAALFIFIIPLLIVYMSQSISLGRKNRRMKELESILAGGK